MNITKILICIVIMINLNQNTCKIFQVCMSVGLLNVFSSHLMYYTHTDFNILHYFMQIKSNYKINNLQCEV